MLVSGNDSFECIPSCIWGKKILKTRLEFLLVLLVVLIDVYVLIPRAWGTEAPQDNVTWVCPLLVTGMRHCVMLHQSITNIMLLTKELPLVKDDIVNRADDLAQEEIAPDPSDSWEMNSNIDWSISMDLPAISNCHRHQDMQTPVSWKVLRAD